MEEDIFRLFIDVRRPRQSYYSFAERNANQYKDISEKLIETAG